MFILLSGWAFFAYAQPANNSPYARYGLGNLNNGANVRSAGVGGMSVAMREDSIPYLVNFLNPASYTSIGFTAFDIGVYGNVATISTSSTKQTVNKANLSYFAFGFPILRIRTRGKIDTSITLENGKFKRIRSTNKRIFWGGAFGLREFSSINYTASDSLSGSTNGSFGLTNYKFQGDGGVNQFYIGLGLAPHKNFSIGLNASYLFGRMNRIQRVEFTDENYFNVKSERFTDVGGFYVDYGAQYSLIFNKDTVRSKDGTPVRKKDGSFKVRKKQHTLIFGGTFAHPMSVRANSTFFARTYTLTTFGEDLYRDTIVFNETKGGSIQMPWKFGLGLTWKAGEKWLIGAEHTQELWSSFRDADNRNDSLADAWKTAFGVEYKPSVDPSTRGIGAYFGKMHYRLGGYYAMSQYMINGTQLPEYGITLGFGFPLRRTRAGSGKYVQSMVNLAVEWGQRGTTSQSLLLENYWNFKLGFTLNDRWFIKRKYD
ncbi:MAG: hypothetical protein ACPGD8_00370 [Flavobacteriales bacterium]